LTWSEGWWPLGT